MKKIIILLLLTISTIMAQSTKLILPTFELDVQYSTNALEQLTERNEIITLLIIVSRLPQDKITFLSKYNSGILVKKEIVLKKSTLLTINDITLDKKYEGKLDDLSILIKAYASPAPFESCTSIYHNDFFIKGTVKDLKNKKHLFEIKVEDDFILDN